MDIVLPLTKQEATDLLDILDMWIAENRDTVKEDPLEEMVWPQGRDKVNDLFEEVVSLRERLRNNIVGETYDIKRRRRKLFNR